MKKLILFVLLLAPLTGLALDAEQVNESGFGYPANTASRIFRHHGWLFALTENENGVELWRKAKKTDQWTEITESKLTEDETNLEFGPIRVFKKKIYLALQNEITGVEVWAAQLHKFRHGLPIWQQVNEDGFGDAANIKITNFYLQAGVLHAAVENSNGYAQIWATEDGETWTHLSENGLGQSVEKITSANFFRSNYYVGTSDGQLFKSSDKETWELVEEFDAAIKVMRKFRQYLYLAVGTTLYYTENGADFTLIEDNGFSVDSNNEEISNLWRSYPSYRLVPGQRWLVIATKNSQGFQIWKSKDGQTWEAIIEDGLGNSNNIEVAGFLRYRHQRYLSTGNTIDGTEVYRL